MIAGHTAPDDLADQILVRSRPGADMAAPLAALAERLPGTGVVDQPDTLRPERQPHGG